MVFITRREQFSAAHKLAREDWSPEKNLKVFGKCSNPSWHGHNYELFVTVKGEPNSDTGFVMDLKDLKTMIHTHILQQVDHKNIDVDTVWMKGRISTTENLAIAIWEQLDQPIRDQKCALHSVRIKETENNFVEYFGK